VTHRATTRFWQCYELMPEEIRAAADRSFALLKANPRHPSLRFKKLGRFWSARVGGAHRALALEDDEGFIWVWIGSHDEYEETIRRR